MESDKMFNIVISLYFKEVELPFCACVRWFGSEIPSPGAVEKHLMMTGFLDSEYHGKFSWDIDYVRLLVVGECKGSLEECSMCNGLGMVDGLTYDTTTI